MDRHRAPDLGVVVAIELVAGSSRAEEWGAGEVPQPGDVVEEIRIGSTSAVHRAPFKGGSAAIHKALRAAFKRGETSVSVRSRRLAVDPTAEKRELQACIVPSGGGVRRQYVLRSIHDPNYAVGFVDRTESECIALQGSRGIRVVCALSKAQLQDGFVRGYPWEKKIKAEAMARRGGGAGGAPRSLMSLLMLPKASDESGSRYNSLDDTLARATSWFFAATDVGVPIVFNSIQTESLLTKISGETASATVSAGSLSDLSDMANVSLYGFEDYHGVDIGVVRAVRLWFSPAAGELSVEIKLLQTDTRLGFAISRTEEGFIYISSVVEEEDNRVASTRSGLRELYKEAARASKLLVISRVSNEKVLPWMVSSTGAIRCFDTVSISQKLSLHRHALRPIVLHLLMWESDRNTHSPSPRRRRPSISKPANASTTASPTSASTDDVEDENEDDDEQPTLEADAVGDLSFRFHGGLQLPNNWV